MCEALELGRVGAARLAGGRWRLEDVPHADRFVGLIRAQRSASVAAVSIKAWSVHA